MKPPLGLDCDGVLANLAGWGLAAVNRRLGTHYRLEEWTHHSIGRTFGPEADRAFHQIMEEGRIWYEAGTYPGTRSRLARLAGHYDLYVISAMPARYLPLRQIWLARYRFPIREFIAAGSNQAKVEMAGEIGCRVFVEDHPQVAGLMRAAGIRCYLVARPWNQAADPDRAGWPQIEKWLMEDQHGYV